MYSSILHQLILRWVNIKLGCGQLNNKDALRVRTEDISAELDSLEIWINDNSD